MWTFFNRLIKTGNFFLSQIRWIGNISLKFEKQVKSKVQNCFSAVELRVTFQTRKILPSIHKDSVPTTQQSLVVYQYECHCDCRYVGRTSLTLQERITQHIPKSIQNKEKPTKALPQRNCKAKTPLGICFDRWTSLTSKS